MLEPLACAALPAQIGALIDAGKTAAAEQRLLRHLPARGRDEQPRLCLLMARIWLREGDAARTRRWLMRMGDATDATTALEAARLAAGLGDGALACHWFEHALRVEPTTTLEEQDRLVFGQCALAAAERSRLPHGRQGSWRKHLMLLQRSEQVLAELAADATDAVIREEARESRERAAKLRKPG